MACHRLASKPNGTAVQRQAAENGVSQFRPSGADHARDAQNFALSGLEAHSLDTGAHHDVLASTTISPISSARAFGG